MLITASCALPGVSARFHRVAVPPTTLPAGAPLSSIVQTVHTKLQEIGQACAQFGIISFYEFGLAFEPSDTCVMEPSGLQTSTPSSTVTMAVLPAASAASTASATASSLAARSAASALEPMEEEEEEEEELPPLL